MEITIFSLNLWRYYGEWQKRLPKIVNHIKEKNPDIILLQECFDDSRFNKPGNNQAKQLNKQLSFKHCFYSIAEKLETERGKSITDPVFDGLGLLSNINVVAVEDFKLKKQAEDKHSRIIQNILFEKDGKKFRLYHTHFSNRDDWAKMHLQETYKLAKKERTKPIIAGDLNIIITNDLKEVTGDEYQISWFVKKYVSYPSKKEVLDYVLLPKNNFQFESIECNLNQLSDHCPLIVKLKFKKDL
ncbi:hypothetical protein HOI26_01745 [Candidatus Woesearchaeota archaeon]|jgi:endonuclease/exonuclease/phosphatase family metal-dependent hydrolase|nr:hypothetical protein [Candidatus Woesearchaeota archaeon]